MIWDPRSASEPESSAVTAFVTAQLAEWCGTGDLSHDENMAELVGAIEAFLKQRGLSGELISSRQLLGMASQALVSIGERRAARRLIVFGTGLAAPAEWMVSYGDALLVLDLKQVTVCDDVNLELIFFANVDAALDSVAEFWDETDGRGFLGLRRVCLAARSLLGCAGKNKVHRLAEEIKAACRARLERLADEREWEYIPHMINLDIM